MYKYLQLQEEERSCLSARYMYLKRFLKNRLWGKLPTSTLDSSLSLSLYVLAMYMYMYVYTCSKLH